MFMGISGICATALTLVLAGFTGKYQTSNLGVGGSNPSERATYMIGSAQIIFMIGFYP
jgi:hypothetical protein